MCYVEAFVQDRSGIVCFLVLALTMMGNMYGIPQTVLIFLCINRSCASVLPGSPLRSQDVLSCTGMAYTCFMIIYLV